MQHANACVVNSFCATPQHVSAQYEAALPALQALLAAYPQHVTPEQVSKASFLWACDLWYSYAMEASTPPHSEEPGSVYAHAVHCATLWGSKK